MRKIVPEEMKRKNITVSMDPDIYKLWEKYCSENGIENYSEYIEKLVLQKINK